VVEVEVVVVVGNDNYKYKGDDMHERHKLTRKYLMSLTEGLYLVSNLWHNSTQPYFAENVAPINLREKQWDRIKNVNADQRLCNVFKSKKEHTKWREQFNNNIKEDNIRRMMYDNGRLPPSTRPF